MLKKSIIISVCLMVLISATTFTVYEINKQEQVYAQEKSDRSQISVGGKYTEKVKPDIAYIQIDVRTMDKDANLAQTNNDAKMDKVLKNIKSMGIAQKDLKTINYSMHPVYEWKNIEEKVSGKVERSTEKILKGYQVNNTVRVTIRDLNKVGKVLNLAINEGVTETNMISFGLSDELREEKYIEALKQATKNAENKAKSIASVYNISLDKPKSIVEGSNYNKPIIYTDYVKEVRAENEGARPPIESGELEITASVSVTYEY